MISRVRKIEYVVHTETLDEDGNVIAEGTIGDPQTQQPASFTLYAHQFGDLGRRTEELLANANPGPG